MHEFQQEPPSPPPLITGRDLIEMGYTPGPIFKEILDRVEDLQLENALATREEALEFVKKTFPLTQDSKTGVGD